ncbi:hypothetical protein ATZ35_02455 [Enterococcus rotai]|uniref:DNA methylase N-4/N-6 domain-containing protein n=1 Tax=Enterococcus rotai TaxID=118060 RepID=A0A0U2VMH9_9ENTE|nr:hypothetical protein ATZ35_02455 [Enterococcus rotai]
MDDHELVSVRKILDNIFGKVNYLTTFVWRRRNFSDAHEDYISCDHEYIVCYSKSKLKYLQKKISTWINCEDTLNYREDGFTDLIGSNQASARNHINKLFNNQVVTNYPKPVNLLTSLFSIFVEDGDRILDIFAGSGTTGEACMEISSQNNISVNFTLIQISKPKNNKLIHDVANLTVQRNKQAYKSISKKYAKLDGFSVYLISSLREENIFRNIGENYEK